MPRWPAYVFRAAEASDVDYETTDGVAAVEAFAARWGGFGPEAMLRALRAARGSERRFALALLQASRSPIAREEVVLLLTSADPGLRWSTAYYLGNLQDQRALPILTAMLNERPPDAHDATSEDRGDIYSETHRAAAAHVLGAMGNPICVPELRRALADLLHRSQVHIVPPEAAPAALHARSRTRMRVLGMQQLTIVYALGRLGALGALTGLVTTDECLALLRVELIMGLLHRRYVIGQAVCDFNEVPELASEVRRRLGAAFGLSSAEADTHLKQFENSMGLNEVAEMYAAEDYDVRQLVELA